MTTEKLNWIENYLNAKKGDEDKDVDETLVHNWKPFTDEDIREVADKLTKNDLKRYVNGKYRYSDDAKDFQKEFGIYEEEDKDQELKCDLSYKFQQFLDSEKMTKENWDKFIKFADEVYNKDISHVATQWGQKWVSIVTIMLTFSKYDCQKETWKDNKWFEVSENRYTERLIALNKWFEQNIEGYNI